MDRSDNIQSYIIGEDVVFTPSQRMIVDRLNSKKLSFMYPSCCLEILLNNQGKIVSQDQLILCGWRRNVMPG
jgi:DNA-binding winged helix-turn-helix (wHTH) protein